MPGLDRNYRNLKVWSAAHTLVLQVYAATRTFPDIERFGITSQLRRAAASIAANIAEGSSRSSNAAFAHFIEIAYGSASEAEYQLLLAHDLKYLSGPEYAPLARRLDEIRRMLAALRRTLLAGGGTARLRPVPPSLSR